MLVVLDNCDKLITGFRMGVCEFYGNCRSQQDIEEFKGIGHYL